jgi:hypothetical protein
VSSTYGTLPPGLGWPEPEADHSPPFIAELKSAFAYMFTVPCAFMMRSSVKYRSNSTCFSFVFLEPEELPDETFTLLTLILLERVFKF